MSQKIYLDTNIYLDYCLNRSTKYLAYGDIAHTIFSRAISCEFTIIISDILLFELEKSLSVQNITDILSWLGAKIERTQITEQDKLQAQTIPIHYPDNLHFVLAKKEGAILVSNDKALCELGAIVSHTL